MEFVIMIVMFVAAIIITIIVVGILCRIAEYIGTNIFHFSELIQGIRNLILKKFHSKS